MKATRSSAFSRASRAVDAEPPRRVFGVFGFLWSVFLRSRISCRSIFAMSQSPEVPEHPAHSLSNLLPTRCLPLPEQGNVETFGGLLTLASPDIKDKAAKSHDVPMLSRYPMSSTRRCASGILPNGYAMTVFFGESSCPSNGDQTDYL